MFNRWKQEIGIIQQGSQCCCNIKVYKEGIGGWMWWRVVAASLFYSTYSSFAFTPWYGHGTGIDWVMKWWGGLRNLPWIEIWEIVYLAQAISHKGEQANGVIENEWKTSWTNEQCLNCCKGYCFQSYLFFFLLFFWQGGKTFECIYVSICKRNHHIMKKCIKFSFERKHDNRKFAKINWPQNKCTLDCLILSPRNMILSVGMPELFKQVLHQWPASLIKQ